MGYTALSATGYYTGEKLVPQIDPKKQALQGMVENWRYKNIQEPLSDAYHSGMQGLQDQLTSNPQDTVVGPALATALEMGAGGLFPPYDPSAPAEGAVPLPRGISGEKAKKLLQKIAPGKVPASLTEDEARVILRKLANDKPGEADKLLTGVKQRESQPLITRDPIRSEAGSGRIQPEPKITPAKVDDEEFDLVRYLEDGVK
jgi:hypothetical protein